MVYSDNANVIASTLGDANIRVSNGGTYDQPATLVTKGLSDCAPLTVTYSIPAPNGTWSNADNGQYNVLLQTNQVKDAQQHFFPSGSLGKFMVSIPAPSLSASGIAGGGDGNKEPDHAGNGRLDSLRTRRVVSGGRSQEQWRVGHQHLQPGSKSPSAGGYSDASRSVTWSDGSPTSSDTNEHGYIWQNTLNAGFSFTAPADTNTRTLYVFAGGNKTTSSLTRTSPTARPRTTRRQRRLGPHSNFYTITYHAASAGRLSP